MYSLQGSRFGAKDVSSFSFSVEKKRKYFFANEAELCLRDDASDSMGVRRPLNGRGDVDT